MLGTVKGGINMNKTVFSSGVYSKVDLEMLHGEV